MDILKVLGLITLFVIAIVFAGALMGLEAQVEEINALRLENQALYGQIDALKSENETLKAEKSELNKLFTGYQNKNLAQHQEIEMLRQEVARLSDYVVRLNQDNQRLAQAYGQAQFVQQPQIHNNQVEQVQAAPTIDSIAADMGILLQQAVTPLTLVLGIFTTSIPAAGYGLLRLLR